MDESDIEDQQEQAPPTIVSGPIAPYTPPSHKNRILFVLFMGLVVGGILLGFAFYIAKTNHFPLLGFQSKKTDTASKLPVVVTSSAEKPQNLTGWKSVSNASCAATISYPPDWGVVSNSEEQDDCSVILTHASGQVASRFILTGYRYKNAWDSIKAGLRANTPVQFAGIEAYSFIQPVPTMYQGIAEMKNILARKNDTVYQVTLLYFKSDPGMDQVMDQIADNVKIGEHAGIEKGVAVEDQEASANNSQRETEVMEILNAVGQYTAENKGNFPPVITSVPTEIAKDGIDLCRYLFPTYISQLPQDPLVGNGILSCSSQYKTGYVISKSPSNSVTVTAPRSELGKTISVSR